MPIEVIFLPNGGTQYIEQWIEHEDLLDDEGYRFNLDKWRSTVIYLATQALSGHPFQTSVFLRLMGDHLVDRYDYLFIKEALKVARDHSWGGNIYVVVDSRLGLELPQMDSEESLLLWFKTVMEAGATDIIEAPIDRTSLITSGKALGSGADISRNRYKVIDHLAFNDEYRCVVSDSDSNLLLLLDRFIEYDQAIDYNGRLIIVVKQSNFTEQMGYTKRHLQKRPHAFPAIMMYGYGTIAGPKLRDLCRIRNIGLLRCRGPYELYYYLLRLNNLPTLKTPKGLGSVRQVEPDESHIFAPKLDTIKPCLLLTSSFHPENDVEHCLEASRDAGQITYNIPPNAMYYVHSALHSKAVPSLLRELPPLTAWVYLGHGDGHNGLQVVSGEYESPDLWLSRFRGYGKGLALAFFSACRSADVARRFAEAGAGISIGFENDVSPEACRLLAAGVVGEALRSGGDRKAILDAFHIGCAELAAQQHSESMPIAFHS